MAKVSKFDIGVYGTSFDEWFRKNKGLSNPDREDKQIIDRIIKVYEDELHKELSKPLRAIITAYISGMNKGIELAMNVLKADRE